MQRYSDYKPRKKLAKFCVLSLVEVTMEIAKGATAYVIGVSTNEDVI
jgi:hypothetical protein